jgi:NADP-dependent 3-hydroxy acid dehydrogenase YdfG
MPGHRPRGHRPRALITGASGGIGGAVARALGSTHDLLLGGRDASTLTKLAAALPSAEPWPIELTDWDAVRRATGTIERLDALVHAAGIWEAGRVIDTTPETWQRLLDVNVVAVAELSRRLLPALRSARGRVVMINSIAGTKVTAERGAYGASKFALRALGEALHAEEVAGGVSVTTIYLGRVATDMQRRVKSVEGAPFEAERYLAPESVAAAVVSVLSGPADADVTEMVLHPTLGPR